jgi:fructokinase
VTGPVVVGGECLIDRITSPGGEVREVPGGGPYNTARTVARLGVHAAYLGCISRDPLGERLVGELAADGVDLGLVVRTDAPSTIAHAMLDASGAASYRFESEGTAAPALDRSSALRALDASPSAVHVGTLGLVFEPVGTSLESLAAATPPGTLVMLDPNARPSATPDADAWRARIRVIARRADIVRASTDDLAFLDPGRAPLDAAVVLLSDGAGLVIVTDGGGPIQVLGPGRDPLVVPVPLGPVVDTVGAGDAFGGGFLAWWVERGLGRAELTDSAPVLEATRFASRVAALTCARAGADPPRRTEV